MTNASKRREQVLERLRAINPDNGYALELKRVYAREKIPDKAARPFAILRRGVDQLTGVASLQGARVRAYQVEIVFPVTVTDDDLDLAEVEVLRALGFGQTDPEQQLPGLVEDDQSSEVVDGAHNGVAAVSLLINFGVSYVETYN